MDPPSRPLIRLKLESLASDAIFSSMVISIYALELDIHQDLILIAVLQASMQVFAFVLGARQLSVHKMPVHAFFSWRTPIGPTSLFQPS
jgi:hypothetical protein